MLRRFTSRCESTRAACRRLPPWAWFAVLWLGGFAAVLCLSLTVKALIFVVRKLVEG